MESDAAQLSEYLDELHRSKENSTEFEQYQQQVDDKLLEVEQKSGVLALIVKAYEEFDTNSVNSKHLVDALNVVIESQAIGFDTLKAEVEKLKNRPVMNRPGYWTVGEHFCADMLLLASIECRRMSFRLTSGPVILL